MEGRRCGTIRFGVYIPQQKIIEGYSIRIFVYNFKDIGIIAESIDVYKTISKERTAHYRIMRFSNKADLNLYRVLYVGFDKHTLLIVGELGTDVTLEDISHSIDVGIKKI